MALNQVTFVCVVPNYWGSGATLKDSKSSCKKAGGKLNKKLVIFKVEHDNRLCIFVDFFGSVCWQLTDKEKENNNTVSEVDSLIKEVKCDAILKRGFAKK